MVTTNDGPKVGTSLTTNTENDIEEKADDGQKVKAAVEEERMQVDDDGNGARSLEEAPKKDSLEKEESKKEKVKNSAAGIDTSEMDGKRINGDDNVKEEEADTKTKKEIQQETNANVKEEESGEADEESDSDDGEKDISEMDRKSSDIEKEAINGDDNVKKEEADTKAKKETKQETNAKVKKANEERGEADEESDSDDEKKEEESEHCGTPEESEDDMPEKKDKNATKKESEKKRRVRRPGYVKELEETIGTPEPGKRVRKTVERHAPPDFTTEKEHELVIEPGRGNKISDIESVKDSILAAKKDSPVLRDAYKLIFGGGRGRGGGIKQNLIKGRLLQFSGYLPPEKDDKIDEDHEAKMATRAFKLYVPQLKNLCDLFDVDRTGTREQPSIDKEALVDRLLDFLGAPTEKLTKTHLKQLTKQKSKEKSPKKRKKPDSDSVAEVEAEVVSNKKQKKQRKRKIKKEESEEETEDDESSVEEEKMDTGYVDEGKGSPKDKMPSDKHLRKWVRAYVQCFNLDKATTKHAIETASDKFGVNLTEKKSTIKQMLAEELS